jgi:GNAT superfamily N-acetyltransferase
MPDEEGKTMVTIVIADPVHQTAQIRDIFWEYLQWVNEKVKEEYQVEFDIQAILDQDMADLGKFMPPKGRLLLGYVDDQVAGIACLTALDGMTGEVRRMYVRPEHRRIGLGRALLVRLLEEAVQIGYPQVRLDSAGFMGQAHQLYRSVGFREISPYAGSEIPEDFQAHWVFMEMDLPHNLPARKPDGEIPANS